MQGRLVQDTSVVLLALLFVVQAGAPQAQEPPVAPYKIGALFAITGPAASLGQPERDAARMLEEHINAQGGINGHQLMIVMRDTKSQQTEALHAAKELIEQEEVLAIVGPTRSGTTLGVVEYMRKSQTPLVSCGAAARITTPAKEWVFKTCPEDRHAVARIYEYLQAQDISRIALMTVANAFGESGLTQLRAQANDAGIMIVAEEQFMDTDTDTTAQLTTIKGTDAQALICWDVGPATALVARQVRQLGVEIPLIQSHAVASRHFIEGAGEAADGVLLPAPKLIVAEQLPDDDPQKQTLLKYAADFRAKYGRDPDTYGALAWDAVQLIVRALRAAGPDRGRIRDALENTTDFVGVTGIFNYSPEDHAGLTSDAFVMVRIEDGQWTLIEQ